MNDVVGFSYNGLPRLLIPSYGGFSINYQCSKCGRMFATPVFPPDIWDMVVNRLVNKDLECLVREVLSDGEFKTIFETGICKKCEGLDTFGGNKIKE